MTPAEINAIAAEVDARLMAYPGGGTGMYTYRMAPQTRGGMTVITPLIRNSTSCGCEIYTEADRRAMRLETARRAIAETIAAFRRDVRDLERVSVRAPAPVELAASRVRARSCFRPRPAPPSRNPAPRRPCQRNR